MIQEIEKKLLGVSETPFLDAKFFVEGCEQKGRLISDDLIDDFIERRKKKEPVSKIIESRGFWAFDFYVTKDVLDPRPDSETLIEAVLEQFPDKQRDLSILDIGTGSGCLLVSLLYEYKNAVGTGVDISLTALEVAKIQKDSVKDSEKQTSPNFTGVKPSRGFIKELQVRARMAEMWYNNKATEWLAKNYYGKTMEASWMVNLGKSMENWNKIDAVEFCSIVNSLIISRTFT